MDSKISQLPGKSVPSKPKFIKKASREAPKLISHEPLISRQKRVFGTVKSTNIPIRTLNEKPLVKPSISTFQKQSKLIRVTQNAVIADKKFNEKLNPRLKKKSPVLKERVKDQHVENVVEPRTPVAVAVPRLFKLKNGGTPYHTAEKCSKCRFDKTETSSYWLSQIKLAESVGKHFVSATFFRLAFECNAEPIRKLRVELKHYLTRHEHLSVHSEWKDVCLSYGLLKDDSHVGGQNSCTSMPEISGKELNKDWTESNESSMLQISSKELNRDQTEAIESSMPEICGKELNEDQTEATESSSELEKDHIVGTSDGELGTKTSQSWPNSSSLEAR